MIRLLMISLKTGCLFVIARSMKSKYEAATIHPTPYVHSSCTLIPFRKIRRRKTLGLLMSKEVEIDYYVHDSVTLW